MVFFGASRNKGAEDQQISLQRGFFIKKENKEEARGLISRDTVFSRVHFKCQRKPWSSVLLKHPRGFSEEASQRASKIIEKIGLVVERAVFQREIFSEVSKGREGIVFLASIYQMPSLELEDKKIQPVHLCEWMLNCLISYPLSVLPLVSFSKF